MRSLAATVAAPLRPLLIPLLATLAATGCGTTSDGGGGSTPGDGEVQAQWMTPHLPLAMGNVWKYKVTHPTDGVSTKTNTVMALQAVGGTGPHKAAMAFLVRTAKGDMDETLSWQNVVEGRVVRYREQSFKRATTMVDLEEHWNPPKLRFDGTMAHMRQGTSWAETFSETKIAQGALPVTGMHTDQWTVERVNEQITVPAGTFTCIRVRKTGTSPDANKVWWYAPGVGKVKEVGMQTEELVETNVRP